MKPRRLPERGKLPAVRRLDGAPEQPGVGRRRRFPQIRGQPANEVADRLDQITRNHQAPARQRVQQVPGHARGGNDELDVGAASVADGGFEALQYAMSFSAAWRADQKHLTC